ncbi:TonB-dependent receptor, partial [Acinetobacter johnsonii]|uniref:TonB-dependent receptor n=1 Tax=Acinetobacter johnsonii TaxID=40214 RepID=UPI0032B6A5F8
CGPIGCAVDFVCRLLHLKIISLKNPLQIGLCNKATSGYNVLNMTLAYKNKLSHTEYDLFFKANNLLDQKVYAHETFLPYIPQIGRNFSLGLNLNF